MTTSSASSWSLALTCLRCLQALPTWCLLAAPYGQPTRRLAAPHSPSASPATSDHQAVGREEGDPFTPSSLCSARLSFGIPPSLGTLGPQKFGENQGKVSQCGMKSLALSLRKEHVSQDGAHSCCARLWRCTRARYSCLALSAHVTATGCSLRCGGLGFWSCSRAGVLQLEGGGVILFPWAGLTGTRLCQGKPPIYL